MSKRLLLLPIISAAVLLAACGGMTAGQVSPAPAPAPQPGFAAVEAQSTVDMANAQLQATADSHARETAVAAQATAARADELMVTSVAATDVAGTSTAAPRQTADAQSVRQTDVAINIVVDSATADASATHVAETPAAEKTATIDAQTAANVAMVQEDTRIRMEQEREREEMKLIWQPRLYGLLTVALVLLCLAAVAFVAFLIWRAVHLQRHPVYSGPNGVSVLQQSQGMLAAPKLMAISGPKPAAARPQVEPPQLVAAAEPISLPVPRRGCWLVAGKRDSGKTTALQAIAAQRRGTIIVVDPRDWPGKWPSTTRVIGRGPDYPAIEAFLVEEMEAILNERARRLADGVSDRVLQAEPIFVMIDELPAIVERLDAACMTSPRRWMYEMRQLGGDLLLATQSLHVRAMGLKDYGDVRRMFDFTLALGDVAVAQFPALVNGMPRPAVLSTLTAARPVIIPYVPEAGRTVVPAGDLDGDGDSDAILLPEWMNRPPLATVPAPVTEPDPDNLTAADRQRIVFSWREAHSLAGVQRAIFPSYQSTGGRAFYAIRRVLEEEGELLPLRDNGGRPAALNPTPGY